MIILGTNSIKDTGFDVANSLRFNSASSDHLKWTSSPSGTNRQKFTLSIWFKRAKLGATQVLAATSYSSGDEGYLYISSGDTLEWDSTNSGDGDMFSSIKLRDTSAWYHLVWSVDTTQSTAGNRMKFYLNGTQMTAWSTETQPNLNQSLYWNVGGTYFPYIGRRHGGDYFDGYMAEIVQIDNQQLDATSFGEFDSNNGIWKPIDVSDLTFGGNTSYYLDFEDSSALGNDVSGQNNDWGVVNLTAIDQSTDTCTNNFATLNSLLPTFSSTFTEGNLKWTPSTASQYYWSNSTFGLSQGKWYMEAKLTTAADHNVIGLSNDSALDNTSFLAGTGGEGDANIAYQYGYKSSNGQVYNNASGSSYGNTYTTNDIIGLYLDLDNNKLYFAKNGTVQNSGTGVSITDPGSIPGGVYFLAVADGTSSNASVWEVNFGSPAFAISSGNTDDNGYGNFEYSPNITGDSVAKKFYALNTKNLAEYG